MKPDLNRIASLTLLWMGSCLLAASGAMAAPHRLDDSQSYTIPPSAQMQWRPITPGQPDAGMEAWVRVNIRIATGEWNGRNGRIYMVLERDETSEMEVAWTTQGRLLPGRLVSGGRALVFAGVVSTDALEDQLLVRLRSHADWQSNNRRLNFHFEFEFDTE